MPITDPRIAAYSYAVGVLQTDAAIVATDVLILAPESNDYQALTLLPRVARPTLWVTPTFEAMSVYCQNGRGGVSYLAPLSLKLELRAPDYNWEAAANIWAAISEAFNPTQIQPAERRAFNRLLRANRISEVEFTPAAPVGPDQIATGQIRFICYT